MIKQYICPKCYIEWGRPTKKQQTNLLCRDKCNPVDKSNPVGKKQQPKVVKKLEPIDAFFLHPAKTGGTAIKAAVKQTNMNWGWPKKPGFAKCCSSTHSKTEELFNRNILSKDIFIVTSIRDPWERCVSYYYFCQRTKQGGARNMGFKPFCLNVIPDYKRFKHMFPCWEYAQYADATIDFNHMQRDFDSVCKKLNKESITIPIVQKMVTNYEKPYLDNYDQETLDFVEEMFMDDIVHLGYRKPTLEE